MLNYKRYIHKKKRNSLWYTVEKISYQNVELNINSI